MLCFGIRIAKLLWIEDCQMVDGFSGFRFSGYVHCGLDVHWLAGLALEPSNPDDVANALYDGTLAVTMFAVGTRNENALYVTAFFICWPRYSLSSYRIRPSVEPVPQLAAHQFALNFAELLPRTVTLLSTALIRPFYYTI